MRGESAVFHPTSRASRAEIDQLVDVYLGWREECVAVHECYRRWCVSAFVDRRLAYSAYAAALDREESAARCYRQLAERISATLGAPDWIEVPG
jgi:hypothetical protein